MSDKSILVIGTYDTKDDELGFLADVIRDQGGKVITMDVSVLGEPSKPTDYSKHDVAEECGSSIKAAIDSGDENHAMQIMANGASLLAARIYAEDVFDGMIVLGGTMVRRHDRLGRHDGYRSGARRRLGPAIGRAEIHRLNRLLLPAYSARTVGSRYTDDPLGRGTLWFELDLQGLALTGGRRCFGGSASSAKARP